MEMFQWLKIFIMFSLLICQLLDSMAENSILFALNSRDNMSVCLTRPEVNSQLTSFSKSSNSQEHCFLAWRHSHSSPISYLEFIMTIVIVIYSARECKLYPMSVHLN